METQQTTSSHNLKKRFRSHVLLPLSVLLVFLLCACVLNVCIGPAHISFSEVSDGLFQPRGEMTPGAQIFYHLRLPHLLLACLIGAVLALVGAALQALFRNPLAEPFMIGISSGSSLAVVVATSLGIHALSFGKFGHYLVPLFAFAGGLGSLALVYWLATRRGRIEVQVLLLAGVVVNSFFISVSVFLTSLLEAGELKKVYTWLLGDIGEQGYAEILALCPFLLVGVILILRRAKEFNAMTFGSETAQHLGVAVDRLRREVFLASALMVGAVVSLSGIIGFAGLVVPHILRRLWGADHRFLLPASLLGGAGFLVVCDILARMLISPALLPVGVITAMTGGPFFLFLLKKRNW